MTTNAPQPSGLPFAFTAYLLWGFFPVYFKLLHTVAALDVLAFRILWSVPVAFIILYFRKQWGEFRTAITDGKTRKTLMLSSALISINWLVYIWAINEGQILATSIGYYLNPLVNVLLGRLFLGERLSRIQGIAVCVAIVGVSVLLVNALDTLWISLILAFSFGGYGLVRKMSPAGSVPGLSVELCLMAPLAAAVAIFSATTAPQSLSLETHALLALGGILTVIPLLLFATAARRMSYTALGFVQYIAPTTVFLLGVFLYDEPLDTIRLMCFGLIWTAIALFSWDAIRRIP
jgi:chloramphenicol-sensitive protein RarD